MAFLPVLREDYRALYFEKCGPCPSYLILGRIRPRLTDSGVLPGVEQVGVLFALLIFLPLL